MLYSVTVREHSVNRSRRGVEWRGLRTTRRVSLKRAVLFLLAFSADHAFCGTFSTLPQISWPFNTHRFSSTSVSGHCQTPQLSIVYNPQVVPRSPGNRTPSKEYITWPFMPRA